MNRSHAGGGGEGGRLSPPSHSTDDCGAFEENSAISHLTPPPGPLAAECSFRGNQWPHPATCDVTALPAKREISPSSFSLAETFAVVLNTHVALLPARDPPPPRYLQAASSYRRFTSCLSWTRDTPERKCPSERTAMPSRQPIIP